MVLTPAQQAFTQLRAALMTSGCIPSVPLSVAELMLQAPALVPALASSLRAQQVGMLLLAAAVRNVEDSTDRARWVHVLEQADSLAAAVRNVEDSTDRARWVHVLEQADSLAAAAVLAGGKVDLHPLEASLHVISPLQVVLMLLAAPLQAFGVRDTSAVERLYAAMGAVCFVDSSGDLQLVPAARLVAQALDQAAVDRVAWFDVRRVLTGLTSAVSAALVLHLDFEAVRMLPQDTAEEREARSFAQGGAALVRRINALAPGEVVSVEVLARFRAWLARLSDEQAYDLAQLKQANVDSARVVEVRIQALSAHMAAAVHDSVVLVNAVRKSQCTFSPGCTATVRSDELLCRECLHFVPGAWICPACARANFASNEECFSDDCAQRRPAKNKQLVPQPGKESEHVKRQLRTYEKRDRRLTAARGSGGVGAGGGGAAARPRS
jgi:hypothetical protein